MKNIKERDNKENYDECSGEESTYHSRIGAETWVCIFDNQ